MFNRYLLSWCIGLYCALVGAQASAGITLSATRLIFDGVHNEVSINVRNTGNDSLIQSWIDSDNPKMASVPFVVTPPLARVSAGEQQLLRVIYEGAGMPSDKESVFWLNVQEIPQADKTQNTLQLAVRQRIKVFFRPVGLQADAYLAPTQLQWQIDEEGGHAMLKIMNPSLYHVSLSNVTVQSGTTSEHPIDSMMIAPNETRTFKLKGANSSNYSTLTFSNINDYGAQDRYIVKLINKVAVSAKTNQ